MGASEASPGTTPSTSSNPMVFTINGRPRRPQLILTEAQIQHWLTEVATSLISLMHQAAQRHQPVTLVCNRKGATTIFRELCELISRRDQAPTFQEIPVWEGKPINVRGHLVVVVDDVVETGITVSETAACLLSPELGAIEVKIVALCHQAEHTTVDDLRVEACLTPGYGNIGGHGVCPVGEVEPAEEQRIRDLRDVYMITGGVR